METTSPPSAVAARCRRLLHVEKKLVEVDVVIIVVVAVIVLRSVVVLAAPLPWVGLANVVARPGHLLVVVIEDDDAVLLVGATSGGDLFKGAALALHLLPDVVVPFEGSLIIGSHGQVLLLDGEEPRLRHWLDEAGRGIELVDDDAAVARAPPQRCLLQLRFDREERR